MSAGSSSNGSSSSGSNSSAATDRLTSLASSIAVSKVSQLQKLEKKLKTAFEEYRSSIDKYNSIRVDFERKLADSCNHFQYAEETHLKQMRVFIESYSKLLSSLNNNRVQIYNEFQSKFEQLTSDQLLQVFIENKRTGTERPEPAQFIDQYDYAKILLNYNNNSQQQQQPNQQTQSPNSNNYLINESEFNLVINGGSLFTTTTLNSSLNASQPPQPISSQNMPVFSQHYSGSNSADNSSNLEYSLFNPNLNSNNNANSNNSRGTPVFFAPANLINTGGQYSPLTNASSITTLNSMAGASGVHGGSATNLGVAIAASSPTNVTSPVNQDNMKRSDSKGINIFNVDFLGRKNKKVNFF